MTGSRRQDWTPTGWLLAAALAFVAAAPVGAQDGQFDLRTRATPTAAPPPVVGPSDPDSPTIRPRPRPAEAAPALVLPSATPAPSPSAAATATPSVERPAIAQRGPVTRATLSPAQRVPSPTATSAQAPSATAAAAPAPAPAPGGYEPRRLDVVAPSGLPGWWLALGALAVVLALGGWLAWSRHFRHRARALPAPEVERPRVAQPAPAPAARPEPSPQGGLALALQATRMSATLINTTLSYRLAVTNRGAEPLSEVRIAGDMIAAHASRGADQLAAAALPELHRIPGLAPGESVTVSGEIRLPLVSITPIRRGNAAFFVPLARLRAHGLTPDGRTVDGGGTFLVGQEPGASKRLQPFRLDLGPRNYSRLSQQLLTAA